MPIERTEMKGRRKPSGSRSQVAILRSLRRLRDRAEVQGRDGVRLIRERSAMAMQAGRAQLDRGESFVAFHGKERPLVVVCAATLAGIAAGLALGSARRHHARG